jgi:adenylylsulfate kinase
MKILIMGLPGAGKTTLAQELKTQLELAGKSVSWLNADIVREQYNDWDFSHEGRIRQAGRMAELADERAADFVICDFVAPLTEMRNIFDPTVIVWMDTIKAGRFEDTNKIFETPENYEFRFTEYDSIGQAKIIVNCIQSAEEKLKDIVGTVDEQISYQI